jgi:hypothetical protein
MGTAILFYVTVVSLFCLVCCLIIEVLLIVIYLTFKLYEILHHLS